MKHIVQHQPALKTLLLHHTFDGLEAVDAETESPYNLIENDAVAGAGGADDEFSKHFVE
jgi:hypothetical protein